jgi:Protein of unknown function (DUF3102)
VHKGDVATTDEPAIPEAADGRLRVCGAQTEVGSESTHAATGGSTWGSLATGCPDLERNLRLLSKAGPPATVTAIPIKVRRAAFNYASLGSDDAEFLRRRATSIRQGIKSTVEAICDIGVQLCGAKQMLGHGQFVQWVELECGFSIRSAQNYIRASVFAADKYATVALLPPATVYRLSAKSAPPDVVAEVLARAANGERVSDVEVIRMLKERKRLASRETENKGRRAGLPRGEASSTRGDANNAIARANARALMSKFGRSGSVVLLGMRENILETLSFLEQEINASIAPDEGDTA